MSSSLNQAQAVALRAASLLRGGMPPSRVWLVIGEDVDSEDLESIAQQVREGAAPSDAIATGGISGAAGTAGTVRTTNAGIAIAETARSAKLSQASLRQLLQRLRRSSDGRDGGAAWRVLAVAWKISEQSGVPLAATLERLATVFRSLERISERRSTLLAGSRSTIRLVVCLPPFALLLGWLMGFEIAGALSSVPGVVAAIAGTLLLILGFLWAQKLTARAEAAALPSGLALELSAISLSGAVSSTEALKRVVDIADEYGAGWVHLADLHSDGPVREAVQISEQLGTPAGPALLNAAEALRTSGEAELEREAERLAIRVLIPLGVCILPAFILLGVVPVVLAMLSGTGF